MLQFIQRALRVFLLDKDVFEAVGTDEHATEKNGIKQRKIISVGEILYCCSCNINCCLAILNGWDSGIVE